MKKAKRKTASRLRSKYGFATVEDVVRSLYLKRYRAGTRLILLDPELAKAFPTEDAVNDALRAFLRMTKSGRLPHRGPGKAGQKTQTSGR
jgi:hypothetical protein